MQRQRSHWSALRTAWISFRDSFPGARNSELPLPEQLSLIAGILFCQLLSHSYIFFSMLGTFNERK
jgi:hypothetical protein